jgi:aspartate kinase
MPLIIQKYGKAYLESVEKIRTAAQHICQTVRAGNSVVVVAPVMAEMTARWIGFADEISNNSYLRERNMILAAGEQVAIALLSMALQELGQPAISLTNTQIGTITEAESTCTRSLNIQTERIKRYLIEGKVVVVTDFQNLTTTENIEICTLEQGVIDASTDAFIIALAAKLQANHCEIYTAQCGLFTADHQIVPNTGL